MKINVLIVEDDPITAQDISETLEEFGMNVMDTLGSGEEVLELIKTNKPDVILMDINLDGDLDGISTAEKLNKTESIPIIYLTANSDKATADRAFQTNPHAFITKPFDKTNIIYAIELAFNNHIKSVFEKKTSNSVLLNSIFLKDGNKYEKVEMSNVLFIEADGSYSCIHTKLKKYFLSKNLNSLWQKIKSTEFFRVHRSYIVNIASVTGFDMAYVYFDDLYVPFSKNVKEELMVRLNKL